MKRAASFYDVASAVMRAAPLALATTYGDTANAQDGGYAVPQDIAKEVVLGGENSLLALCRQLPITQGGSIRLPADITTRYAGAGGIVAAWEDEAAQMSPRKPKLNSLEFNLKKLAAIVAVTDDLLADSDAMRAYLPLAMQTAVNQKLNDAIINGPGTARPLGILKSGALITVSKYGAQAADTIAGENLRAMLARSLDPLASIWIMNPAAYAQASALVEFDSASRTLSGLPIVTTDACPEVGEPGDIILANMSAYFAALKTPQLNFSAHLWFDQDISAFRLTFRMDGMPLLAAPITPPNSGVTKSDFICVEARA